MKPPGASLIAIVVGLSVVLAACAPPAPGGGTRSNDGSGAPGSGPAARGPKVMRLGIQREPSPWGGFAAMGTAANAGGAAQSILIAHANLTDEKELDRFEPELIVEKPTVDRGTWVLNPDGTMETTFRLRPNIKWHDGTPFTAEDLVFSYELYMDPELPTTAQAPRRSLDFASAPDPLTFVVKWNEPYINADRGQMFSNGGIMPRHILEEAYRADKLGRFANSPYFTTEFIGLGPYRLTRWEQGSHLEFERFDEFYRGRPPLDRVILRIIGDANTLVSNILAGELDIVLPVTVELEQALEVRQRWQGTGNRVKTDVTGRLPHLEMQYRSEFTLPRTNGFTERQVRQAFYHATDRDALVEIVAQGLAPTADSWYQPTHPLRGELESAIPRYPYDLNRAQQLLAEAGWTRGADGILVHRDGGARFETELWGLTGQGFAVERQLSIMADGWKAVGAQVGLNLVPAARVNDPEYVASHAGPLYTNPTATQFLTQRLHSGYIPSAQNRWTGFNRSGYVNPTADALVDRYQVTIDPREQVEIQRQLLQQYLGEVAFMPMFWEVVPTLMLKGVKGEPRHVGTSATHNIFEWDKD